MQKTYLQCYQHLYNSGYGQCITNLFDFLMFDSARKSYPPALQESIRMLNLFIRPQLYSTKLVNYDKREICVYYDVTRLLTHNSQSGISRTTWQLYQLLLGASFINVIPVYNDSFLSEEVPLKGQINFKYVDYGEVSAVHYLDALENATSGKNIYHSSYYPIPEDIPASVKKIISLYDIIHLMNKKYYPDPGKYVTGQIAESCRLADVVLSISEFSASQLFSYLGETLPVVLMPLAGMVSEDDIGEEYAVPHTQRYCTSNRLTFAYQNADPRKNITRMILIAEKWLNFNQSNTICIFGNIEDLKKRHPDNVLINSDRVQLVQNPSDSELSEIYQNSSIYLYLSEMEGFGLPPLEAMGFGCPAIMLDNSSLGEVFLGWKGLLADNSTDGNIIDRARELISEPKIRSECIDFSSKYTWATTLCLVISAYLFAISRD